MSYNGNIRDLYPLDECSTHSVSSKCQKANKLKKRWFIHLKEIEKEEMKLLENRKIIFNSSGGFVDKFGNIIGFYRTRNKRYIEDKYVDIAKRLKK